MANKRFDQLTQKTTLHDEDYIAIADSEDLDGNSYPKSKHVLGSAIRKSIFFLSDYANESTPLATVNTTISTSSLDIVYLYIDDDNAENVTFSSKIVLVPAGGILSGTITADRIDQNTRIQIFNASSDVTLNYNDYVLPEWWGAKADGGSTDNTTSLDLIVAMMDAGQIPVRVDYGEGIYGFLTQPGQITTPAISITGQGKAITTFAFSTNSNLNFIDITASASTNDRVNLSDFRITGSGSGNKTYIKLTDMKMCTVLNIEINASGSTGTDIGMYLQGREATHIENVYINVKRPIYIGNDSAIGLDHFNFHNMYIISSSTTYSLIEIEDGINMSNVSFTGYQGWVGGNGAIYDNGGNTEWLNCAFYNIRWESAGLLIPTGSKRPCIKINAGDAKNLNFYNCYIAGVEADDGSATTCVYLRNVIKANFYGCFFNAPDVDSIWLDADNTCDDISGDIYTTQNAGDTNLGSYLMYALGVGPRQQSPNDSTSMFYITNTNFSRTNPYILINGVRMYTRTTEIADGSTIVLPGNPNEVYADGSPTMTQYQVFFDKGTGSAGGGTFAITTNTADAGSEKLSGTANITGGAGGAGVCGLYRSDGSTTVRLKNNMGETRKFTVIIHMHLE